MKRDMRLTGTPFTYILMFYAAGKEAPADFLQKQERWPAGNSFSSRSDPGKLHRRLRY